MAKGKTVLVIEESPANRRLFNDLLRHYGYRVIDTSDARQAMELARSHHPDLVIMDMQIPEISSLEVAQNIKADQSLGGIPIIGLSSLFLKDEEEKARMVGCDAFVGKPITIDHFMETVERFVKTV